MSEVVSKASCLDCQDFNIGKTTLRLHDRKTKHFTCKAISSRCHASAITDPVTSTGHNKRITCDLQGKDPKTFGLNRRDQM